MSEENVTETQQESSFGANGTVDAPASTEATAEAAVPAASTADATANAYQPNFKFTVMEEEKEIDGE